MRIPGTNGGGGSEGSLVAGGGQVDLFYDHCNERIDRWTTTDGVAFTRTVIPNNDFPISVSAARDGPGSLYVASERYTTPLEDLHSSLQGSGDGWIPHRAAPSGSTAIAVTPTGELHALRTDDRGDVYYSNALRGFKTWTILPASLWYRDQDILPLVIDEAQDQLHAAIPGEWGIRLCSAAHTGLPADTGTSWTCGLVGSGFVSRLDLALAPDGTLHIAWSSNDGLGYANSLGSFLATNFSPQVSFGVPSSTPTTVIVPVTISDVDSDDLAGEVHVGRFVSQMGFVPYVTLTYSGALPDVMDISTVPAGATTVAIGVSDGSTSSFNMQSFTKTAGQVQLVLTPEP